MSAEDGGRTDPKKDPLQFALEEIAYLERIIDGMPREGVPGLKHRVTRVEEALEAAKAARATEEARREGQDTQIARLWAVLKWLGPGGLLAVAAGIFYAIQNAGGQ